MYVDVTSKWKPRGKATHVPVVIPHRALTAAVVKAITRHNTLDRRFRPMSRYLERWSVGQGSGLPISDEEADALPRLSTRPTPLSDDESTVADLTILHSPEWFRRFVFMWYRSPMPVEEIAKALDIRVRAVHEEHRIVLAYFLGRFTEAGIRIDTWEPDT